MQDQTDIIEEKPAPVSPAAFVPGESNYQDKLASIRDDVVAGFDSADIDPILKLKQLVVNNYNENRNPNRAPEMEAKFVVILWWTASRGNFKAVCEFTVVRHLRYEVSYNIFTKTAFIEVYKKSHFVKLENV